MARVSVRVGLGVASALVALALFAALASEWWGGLVPCALCLLGRWPYRVAIGFGLLGLVLPGRWVRWAAGGLVAAMLGSAGIGAVHVGVEAGWWPSPLPGCVVRFTPGAGLAGLPARPGKPCDEPSYLVPGLPVSMAAMSLGFSLAVAGGMGVVLARRG